MKYFFLGIFFICISILIFIDLVPTNNQNDKINLIKEEKQHNRTEDQTLLTYPEWFLVFSPEEYVDFTKNNPPHLFPFKEHINQFWHSYDSLSKEIKKQGYKDNKEYNEMINIIGWSTTIEYNIRYFYEISIGNLSWTVGKEKLTNEDKYYNNCYSKYVEFIKLEPWYKFDFLSYIIPMWSISGDKEQSLIRRYERKIAMTLDFGFKSIYGRLIGLGATNNYEKPIFYTTVEFEKELNKKIKVERLNKEKNIYLFPRYQLFTESMKELISFEKNNQEYFKIKKIAGNSNYILVSIISDNFYLNDNIIYKNIISTNQNKTRYLLKIDINDFDINLSKLIENKSITIEHIFDF